MNIKDLIEAYENGNKGYFCDKFKTCGDKSGFMLRLIGADIDSELLENIIINLSIRDCF